MAPPSSEPAARQSPAMDEEEMNVKADQVFDAYTKVRISWGAFMFEDAPHEIVRSGL